ncbi:hypothetical protein AXG93_1356s1250 [Marchantia polymorpha subsp. ruderalis]|uniref:UDP-galactose transporter n=1 Tax=Marchantia polymorpha subsp. ruderalis TaxID=1480154 RepID=A0A176WSN6_MARPO|nr:hypothetical protein AXG93_1356s1250 [Marchantia polymorpha subsp. ruderalis]
MEGGFGAGRVLVLGVCVAGIWSAYVYQGVLQETLSTKKFGPDGLRFEHLTFLGFAQNVVCFAWSFLSSCEVVKDDSRYTIPEYLCTLLVAGGVATFALFKSSRKSISKIASPNAPLGYTLCFINLGLDGFTNATQDSITSKYPKTSAWHIMLGMNLWGSVYMAIYMFVITNGGFEAVEFCRSHPEAFRDILLFCLCGAVGQNFIFLTISRFGALTNTTITTTRKFVSILVSALWNGNPLSFEQWTGVVMVFLGLTYQIVLKWQKRKSKGSSKLDAAASKKA